MVRDNAENWQSEFLQLIWQVAGLAFPLYISSPQSKEGDDRKEEKLVANAVFSLLPRGHSWMRPQFPRS
jgi:UV DNA damage repair endonuclease